MRVLCALGLVSFIALAQPALAGKPDYCAAYARDFADVRAKDKSIWQHKYDISFAACMAEPQKADVIKPAPVKKQTVKIAAPAVKPPVVPPEPAVVEKPTPKAPKIAKLEPGTPAWNDYCTKKYTSFNVKTGTYKSRTGVERKCLVNS